MVTYNLVNSVKGGCGKTTFSISLARYLNSFSNEKKEITSILVDVDLLGTSMQSIFYGSELSTDTFFTNDVFKGVDDRTKTFVKKVELKDDSHFNIVFASMRYEEKEKFKSGRYAGYSPVVKHSIFRAGIQDLIKTNKKIGDKEVEHFIFDMPPNSDGFSDAVMECILSPKYSVIKKGKEKENRTNLFMLIGSDWGQTIATIAELKVLLTHSDGKLPDRIFLVLNDNMQAGLGKDKYLLRKQKFESELSEIYVSEDEKNRIFFLKTVYLKEYFKIGAEEKGLCNLEKTRLVNVFSGGVITEYAKFNDEIFKEIKDRNELQKLILGEENDKNKPKGNAGIL